VKEQIMSRRQVLELLKDRKAGLQQRFRVLDVAVFGSVARDEDSATSDVDVLVKFDGQADFDQYMDLMFYLEEFFGRPVDLVTTKGLRPELREQVEREAIHVA
jgi:predicted nucleotidyltransferase